MKAEPSDEAKQVVSELVKEFDRENIRKPRFNEENYETFRPPPGWIESILAQKGWPNGEYTRSDFVGDYWPLFALAAIALCVLSCFVGIAVIPAG